MRSPQKSAAKPLVMETAKLQWTEDQLPESERHGDLYFSKHNAIEETRHVFLQHNHLTERWQDLPDNHRFTIAETGFGSGLNFLCAWELWDSIAPPNAQLHFISVEKYPMTREQITRTLQHWPELEDRTASLLERYPKVFNRGTHTIKFGHRVSLHLIFGDVVEGLTGLLKCPSLPDQGPKSSVDAWFLDGFAPAKNESMWQQCVFDLMAQLASEDATFATFTAAGFVRRGLIAAGFSVEKVPGFGSKRDMCRGQLNSSEKQETLDAPNPPRLGDSPWYVSEPAVSAQSTTIKSAPPHSKQAVVVGGGMAGCQTARALADKGWQVTLIEQHGALAQEGSGNPQGIVYGKLSHRSEKLTDFNLTALQFALRQYQQFWQICPEGGDQCGVIQLESGPERHQQLIEALGHQHLVESLSGNSLSAIAGVGLGNQHGLFFRDSGWINPPKLCQWLIDHPNILVREDTRLKELDYQESQQYWQLTITDQQGEEESIDCPVVILCSASHTKKLPQTQWLPTKSIRGQITLVPSTESTKSLKTVLCGDGYIAPAKASRHCLGATFNLNSTDTELATADHRENLDRIDNQMPTLQLGLINENTLTGRVAFRCTTPDYLPLTGPAPDYQAYLSTYSELRKNARLFVDKEGPNYPGLYLNLGHGSRGLTYTPLCAEALASHINGDPSSLSPEFEQGLHPARFIIRDLIRKKV